MGKALDELAAGSPPIRRWAPPDAATAKQILELRERKFSLIRIARALTADGSPVTSKTLGVWLQDRAEQADG